MNRTNSTARTENRGSNGNRAPRDHYQAVTDRIIAALEAGTPPWRRPWDPDKAGGPATPRNAATDQRYRGINVLTLGMSALAFSSGDPRWATYKQAEDQGWQVRKGERGMTGYFFKRLEVRDDTQPDGGEETVRRIPLLRAFTLFHASQIDGVPAYVPPTIEEAPWRHRRRRKSFSPTAARSCGSAATAPSIPRRPITSRCRRTRLSTRHRNIVAFSCMRHRIGRVIRHDSTATCATASARMITRGRSSGRRSAK
jgi:N-terminal domain of anti-restriction factor ArdC